MQHTLECVQRLLCHSSAPAQGGTCALESRKGKPNGTGWSARFHDLREVVEKALLGAPADLRRAVQPELTLLKLPAEGGRFNSKSKWLYLEPLLRLEQQVRDYASGRRGKRSSVVPAVKRCDDVTRRVARVVHHDRGGAAPSGRRVRVAGKGGETHAVALALRKTKQLGKFCSNPSQGGTNPLETRSGKPNGTGFSAHFHRMRLGIEAAVAGAPIVLQKKLVRHLKLMRTRREGGRFDAKSKWIYMEPLLRVESVLEKHV